MYYNLRIMSMVCIMTVLASTTGCGDGASEQEAVTHTQQETAEPLKVQIIIGSVRRTDTGKKLAAMLKSIADDRPEVVTEIVDIAQFNLPAYTDITPPASREGEITDPVLKAWSDKVAEGQAYIIVAPEYNAGYPGPLKNAFDSLYAEWKGKPVAIVGYSGGPSGGASMIEQLRTVLGKGFEMIPVTADIKIPQSWKAFNEHGDLIKPIDQEMNVIIDQLLAAQHVPNKK